MQQLTFSAVESAIIDFRSGTPVISSLGRSGFESIAHAENSDGDLLFWLWVAIDGSGRGLYLANGNLIPGSDQILAHQSATESIICPMPGNPDQFFIIATDLTENPTFFNLAPRIQDSRTYYSIVDLSMNGGAGGMRSINTLIGNDSDRPAEGMEVIALRNPCTDLYDRFVLLQYDMTIDAFTARVFDSNGFQDREILFNYSEPSRFNGRGELEFHRGKVGMAFAGSNRALVFDYDPIINQHSNQVDIDVEPDGFAYFPPGGLEFSPDGSKLYLTRFFWFTNSIYQIELDNGLVEHKYNDSNEFDRFMGAIELGPDDRIYIAGQQILPVFENPNLPRAPLTNIDVDGFLDLGFGITDPVQYHTEPYTIDASEIPINITPAECACDGSLTLSAPEGLANYLWSPGGQTSREITVNVSGQYSVTASDAGGCEFASEVLDLTIERPQAEIILTDVQSPIGAAIGYNFRIDLPARSSDCPPLSAEIVFSVDAGLLEFIEAPALNVTNVQERNNRLEVSFETDIPPGGIIPSMNFAACPQGDLRVGSLKVESIDIPGCEFDFTLEESTLTLLDPIIEIEGDRSLCFCTPQTTLTAPDGYGSYTWFPGNISGQILTVDSPGDYFVVLGAQNCELRSETVSVTSEDFDVELRFGQAAGAPGDRVTLTLDAGTSGDASPECAPNQFEMTMQYNQFVAAVQELPAGLEPLNVDRAGLFETVQFRASLDDLPVEIPFILLADIDRFTDLTVTEFDWIGCEGGMPSIVDGQIEVDSVCISTRVELLGGVTLMTVEGPNPSNQETRVRFTSRFDGVVELQLRSMNGSLVRRIRHERLPAGQHLDNIDVSNLAAGQYLLILQKTGEALESCLLQVSQ